MRIRVLSITVALGALLAAPAFGAEFDQLGQRRQHSEIRR